MPEAEERRSLAEMRRYGLFTIRALAEQAGVSSRTIVDIEHGRTVPQLGTIKSISRALDVNPLSVEEFARVIEGDTKKEAARVDLAA